VAATWREWMRKSFRPHQVPGFAVFFKAHQFGFAVGIEAQHGRGTAGGDGQDVPEIERNDVGDEEIDIEGGVDGASFADGVGSASFVGAGAKRVGGFDLDAQEAASIVEDEVVALGVSPGLGDAEAEFCGLLEEGGFGALAGALGVLELTRSWFHFCVPNGRWCGVKSQKPHPISRRERDKDGASLSIVDSQNGKGAAMAAPHKLSYSYIIADRGGNEAKVCKFIL